MLLNTLTLSKVTVFTFLCLFTANIHSPPPPLPAGEYPALSLNTETLPMEVPAELSGDLPVLRERGVLRVLVNYSETNFAIIDGKPRGFSYEMFRRYEKFLNRGIKQEEFMTHVVFVPLNFNELIPALLRGQGDVIAAGLTVTPERRQQLDFSQPYLSGINEILVTFDQVSVPETLEQLAGAQLVVLRDSSYVKHLRELNRKLMEKGHKPIDIVKAPANLDGEDILQMLNAGIIEMTVMDDYIAKLWASVLPHITAHPELKIHAGGDLAWGVRHDSPELLASLNEFLEQHRQGTLVGNILFKRYYRNVKQLKNPLTRREISKRDRYVEYFKRFSQRYGFDWRAIAAQAYQESGFDPDTRSPAGAVGLMQLLPSTARSKEVGIRNLTHPEQNIHAGVKYMHYLREQYFSGPELDNEARFYFTLAAYNAGPTRIRRLRRVAGERGLNPNKWFANVEEIALEKIGRETVRYVSNIKKYYTAYQMAEDVLRKRGRPFKLGGDPLALN